MFTTEQIKTAHSKVKSGADFPAYIRDLKQPGVMRYETFVTDGHTDSYGVGDYIVATMAKYEPLLIEDKSNPDQFKADLKSHQQGNISYRGVQVDS